jgi:hypothetical protein
MPPDSLLRRVRWGNVARLLALPAVVVLVVLWPRLSPAPPRLPEAGPAPVAGVVAQGSGAVAAKRNGAVSHAREETLPEPSRDGAPPDRTRRARSRPRGASRARSAARANTRSKRRQARRPAATPTRERRPARGPRPRRSAAAPAPTPAAAAPTRPAPQPTAPRRAPPPPPNPLDTEFGTP